MTEKVFQPGEHYDYPLIIKKLLQTPLIYAPDQEIVYRDRLRYTYRDLNDRIHRLADSLKNRGSRPAIRWRSSTTTATGFSKHSSRSP